MTTWKVPPDTSQKEKIVGGVLTAAQLMWMILGVGIAALLSLSLGPILGIVGIAFGLIVGIGAGCFFCFFKRQGIPIFTYIRLTLKQKKKNHKLIHRESKNKKLEFIGGDY